MIDLTQVGKKITLHRKELSLSQDQLAEKLYISRQLVSKWENGMCAPSIEMIIELSKLFQISFEELLCLEQTFEIDENDIFKGKNRMLVIKEIIRGRIKVKIEDVLYQFSPSERMIILRAIKDGHLFTNLKDLYPKLTTSEQAYLRKEDK